MTTMERLARHLLDLLLEMGYHTASVHVEGTVDGEGKFIGNIIAWLECDPHLTEEDRYVFPNMSQLAWESVLRDNRVEVE
jgi:hypothetical protein